MNLKDESNCELHFELYYMDPLACVTCSLVLFQKTARVKTAVTGGAR